MSIRKYNWLSMAGQFSFENDEITFAGGEVNNSDGSPAVMLGNLLCDQYFIEGKIEADIEFSNVEENCGCDIMFNYSNLDGKLQIASVGINKNEYSMFELKSFRDGKWSFHQISGDSNSLSSETVYKLEMQYIGSSVVLRVNGVEVINSKIPYSLGRTQVGIWSNGKYPIKIRNYHLEEVKPKTFVIMQFSPQFNELYNEVIIPSCEDHNLEVVRADDIYNNGMIINDITRNINEAKIIIADISVNNPNVYYEVGYSHALGKNTILLAEEGAKLPFDISSYRVVFYKNTIAGKQAVEEQLHKHLRELI